MSRKLIFTLAGVACAAIWLIAVWQLSFGSVTFGTVLMIASGLAALVVLGLWRSDRETTAQGIVKVIGDLFSSGH